MLKSRFVFFLINVYGIYAELLISTLKNRNFFFPQYNFTEKQPESFQKWLLNSTLQLQKNINYQSLFKWSLKSTVAEHSNSQFTPCDELAADRLLFLRTLGSTLSIRNQFLLLLQMQEGISLGLMIQHNLLVKMFIYCIYIY